MLLGGDETGFLGEMDKCGNGFGLHFLHDTAAVDLDRLKCSPPFKGYLLTQHSAAH